MLKRTIVGVRAWGKETLPVQQKPNLWRNIFILGPRIFLILKKILLHQGVSIGNENRKES